MSMSGNWNKMKKKTTTLSNVERKKRARAKNKPKWLSNQSEYVFRITKIKTFACECVPCENCFSWVFSTENVAMRVPCLMSFTRKSQQACPAWPGIYSLLNVTVSTENYLWHRVNEENWVMAINCDSASIFAWHKTCSLVSHFCVSHRSFACRSKSKTIRVRSAAVPEHKW